MTAIYGHKWASAYGETDADDTWASGLKDMTPQNLADGLRACLDRAEPWPPTLPEFRALCKPETPPAYHQEYVPLPKPKISKEEALAWVNKIRAELKV